MVDIRFRQLVLKLLGFKLQPVTTLTLEYVHPNKTYKIIISATGDFRVVDNGN